MTSKKPGRLCKFLMIRLWQKVESFFVAQKIYFHSEKSGNLTVSHVFFQLLNSCSERYVSVKSKTFLLEHANFVMLKKKRVPKKPAKWWENIHQERESSGLSVSLLLHWLLFWRPPQAQSPRCHSVLELPCNRLNFHHFNSISKSAKLRRPKIIRKFGVFLSRELKMLIGVFTFFVWSGRRIDANSLQMVYYHDLTIAVVELGAKKLLLGCELIEVL